MVCSTHLAPQQVDSDLKQWRLRTHIREGEFRLRRLDAKASAITWCVWTHLDGFGV
jgi:hypothetical protein